MPLIMGIGDEVIHFLVGLLVMVVAAFAWWSTNARPDRYRAVILRPYRYNNDTLTTVRGTSGDRPVSVRYANDNTIDTGRTGTGALAVESPHTIDSDGDLVPLQEMDSIVDAHMALLDNNRLHFYRRVQYAPPRMVHITVTDAPFISDIERSDPEPPSNAQIREMDSIVSAMEADETACDVFTRPQGNESNSSSQATSEKQNEDKEPESNSDESNAEGAEVTSEEASERKILIRLKYLNDTLKEVEGRLDELLKDFKWRHFSSELSASSRVRLIFNGRVLCDEAATLQALGLHHRAVVHCLVHPRRNTPQRGGASSGNGTVGAAAEEPAPLGGLDAAPGPRAAPERAWDLENILMTLVSVALTVVWFFRCEYSNMFTASASVALFGLTVFYSVAIFGLYLSDTFHFERRPPRVPNN